MENAVGGAIPKIYLAGPEVFFTNRDQRAAELKNLCKANGLEGLFPYDSFPKLPADDKREFARQVYNGDIGLLDRSDGVIANMTPFRGLSMDVGTAYEIGYAVARGKPVFGWSEDHLRSYYLRAEQEHNQDDMILENFTLTDNLMVVCPLVGYHVHESFEAAVEAAGMEFSTRAANPIS